MLQKLQKKKRNKNCIFFSLGKTEDNIKQVTDVSTTTENFNCVQESLPTKFITQQLPKQKQLKDEQEEHTVSKSQLSIKSLSKKKESKESCTEDYFGASGEEKFTISNTGRSVKIMQLEVKENSTISQQQEQNVSNSNEQQQQNNELEQRKTQCSDVINVNNVTKITLTDSTDSLLNNNEPAENNNNNNNNKKSNHLNKTNNLPAKHDKRDKKKKGKYIGKNKTPATSTRIAPEAHETSKGCSNKIISLKDDELLNEPKISNCSTIQITNVTSCTISTDDEKTKTEIGGDVGNSAEDVEKKEKDATASSSEIIDDAANVKQPSESLIGVMIRYNREQLMQLREANGSRIKPEANLIPDVACSEGARPCSSGNGNFQDYIRQNLMFDRAGADSGKSIIYLNLSLNQEVNLKEADNAWRPTMLSKCSDADDPEQKTQREKEALIRHVRGILNKLTPEKFEPLVEEVINLKIDTMEKMEAVMILVFEKAVDEPNFSVSYACLCQRLISEVKVHGKHMESGTKMNVGPFLKALLTKTQQEFTQNVIKSDAKEEKLNTIREKISNCKDATEKNELEALLDDEELKIRRRSGGTVRFIGELFKISLLTGNIINSCIEALLKEPNNEDMLECLCKLLTTVGQKFEQTNMHKSNEQKYSLESVIKRMHYLTLKNENSKISSRIRFMLQDVIDLRKRNWQLTNNEAPKTMEQIEKDVNNEKLNTSYNCMNTLPGVSVSAGKRDDADGCNDGRNYRGRHSQRGGESGIKRQQGGIGIGSNRQLSGNSNNDDTWHVQTGKGIRSMPFDSSKLVGMAVDMKDKKMGGAALFQWNKVTAQPTLTTSNSFAVLSLDSHISSDQNGNRDRSSSRNNKGSYNKGSMKRDRYDNDRIITQTDSTQTTRKNSSPSPIAENSLNMQKSSSHTKYQQQLPNPTFSIMNSSKRSEMVVHSNGAASDSSLSRDIQQQSSYFDSNARHQQQQEHEFSSSPSITPIVFKQLSSLDLKVVKAIVIDMIEYAANSKCIDAVAVSRITEIKENQMCGLLYYILTEYLHLANVGPTCRRHLGNVVTYLIENKYISIEHFRLAYNNFFELATDLMVDIPELWLYIFEFTGPLIVKKLITVNDLWNSLICENDPPGYSLKFLKSFLQYCTHEVGPRFTRNLWKENHLKWTSFMNANDVDKFIETNKYEYVENENSQPDIESKESIIKRHKHVVEHIEQLLKEGSNTDNIIDYINGNIYVDTIFIKSLTTTLTSFAIKHSNNCSLDLTCFQKICIPVLLHYLKDRDDLELESLSAIQQLVRNLEQPEGLLETIFAELGNAGVISQNPSTKALCDSEVKEI